MGTLPCCWWWLQVNVHCLTGHVCLCNAAGCRQWRWVAVVDRHNWRQRSRDLWHLVRRQRQGVRTETEVKAHQFIVPSSGRGSRGCFATATSAPDPLQHFDVKMVCCSLRLCHVFVIFADLLNWLLWMCIQSSSFLACNSRLRSAIRRHHPPQRAVLSQSGCFGERKMVLFQILLDGAEPRDAGTT